MKLQEARNLIKATFESPFDKGRFTLFVKNLLKDAYEEKTFLQTGGQLPQAFADLIRKMERIGKYQDEEGNIIDILIVELKKGRSIEWARTTQRNFIRRYLNGSRGGELKDAALVAFYSDGSDDWRFSLIKMQYSLERKADELTPAKRFSFLVGKNERSHTAQNQLADLLTHGSVPALFEIESAFNIETVTKEFFEKYRELFLNLNDHIEKEIKKTKPLREELESQGIDAASFTKKLLGQIVFLYFLQKKGWLGVPKNENWDKGDKQFLRSLLAEAIEKRKNFFSDYLVYLFYEALATEHRGGSDPSYYARLNCRIPFLNGGLFEADYDWKKIAISIPNNLFTNSDKTEQGDIGSGVLDVFDRYNFTVKEDEPLEKQVAVDPEMLGKVFENLLEVTDRKSKGTYYTPREVVHYMCQESLISYLDISLNSSAASYQKLGQEQLDLAGNASRKGQLPLEIAHGKNVKVPRIDLVKFIREGISAIDNDTLVEEKGYETKTIKYNLPDSIRNYAEDLDNALASIRLCDPAIGSGAFPVGMMNEIVKAREILSVYLRSVNPEERTAYELKRQAIQECIYGVDLDHSAIDIAKLRLWLSLVVDEDDFYKIKPLPNLDYKIVCGNSLQGIVATDLFRSALLTQIENLKPKFFAETNLIEKQKLRKQINKLFKELTNNDDHFDYEIYFSEVFHKKKGFDIVIGNPPYGADLTKEEKDQYKIQYSDVHMRTPDTFNYFISKSFRILNKEGKGLLSFIVSNNLLFQNEYLKTRELFLKKSKVIKVLNLGDEVFEKAVVPSCVFLVQNRADENYNFDFADLRTYKQQLENLDFNSLLRPFTKKDILETPSLVFGVDKATVEIIKRVEEFSDTIDNIALEVASGISTGGDKIFRISQKFAKDNDFEDELLRKVLKGSDINKYSIVDPNYYLIYTTRETKINDYPIIKEYLSQFKKQLNTRSETKQGILPWYSLGRQRYEKLFEEEKIIIRQTSDSVIATLDTKGFYVLNSILVLKLKSNCNYSYKFVLGVLNSNICNFIYKQVTQEEGRVFAEVKPQNIRKLFIPKIKADSQKPFENIVDYLLFIKSRKENEDISSFVPNSFIADFLEKVLNGCVYELYFKEHMKEQKIDILKYVDDYIIPFSPSDTISKKSEIVLKAFNKLNQSDNIIRNRLLLFATRSENVIMNIEKSIVR